MGCASKSATEVSLRYLNSRNMKGAIVICGQIGSGKSTVSALLASKLSIQVVSFGKYIRHMAESSSRSTTRSALQDLGDSLYQAMGASGLLKGALDVAGTGDSETIIFDGVRHTEVLKEIRQTACKTIAIYLDVGKEERYQRRRSQGDGSLSREQFEAIEGHAVESEIGDLAEFCDFVIDASQPLTHLQDHLPTELFTFKKQ